MHYSLSRVTDKAGDSGLMSMAIYVEYDPEGIAWRKTENNARPRVGVIMRVGTPFSRTYAAQDYWQTTLIEEILEDTPEYVKFRTTNSVYEWKTF